MSTGSCAFALALSRFSSMHLVTPPAELPILLNTDLGSFDFALF